MGEVLKGAPVAARIKEYITERVNTCKSSGINPKIAIVRVGKRGDDIAYEKRVISNCEKLGILTDVYELPLDIVQEDFEREFKNVNDDKSVHGILLFRPLPKTLDEEKICGLIDSRKDIDCMSPDNLTNMFDGNAEGFSQCTPEAVMEILKYYNVPLRGANAVVVNRSMVLGKPLAMMLLKEDATVTICHSKTLNMKEITGNADIVITGVGKAKYFKEKYFSEKSVVVDVGINFVDGKMAGDVDFDSASDRVKAITPVPGGVGAVTSTILLKHAVDAAWRIGNEQE